MNRSEMREQAFILLFEKEFLQGNPVLRLRKPLPKTMLRFPIMQKKHLKIHTIKRKKSTPLSKNILKAGKSAGCRRSISRFCDLPFMR